MRKKELALVSSTKKSINISVASVSSVVQLNIVRLLMIFSQWENAFPLNFHFSVRAKNHREFP